MRKRRTPSASLEREVIVAVTVLYAIICATMLLIHYLQPSDAATQTSSMSPSHDGPAHAPAQGAK